MRSTPAEDRRRAPDRTALAAWLTSPSVVDADGAVAAWSNPLHPGFAYPEAAGWWLAWAAWRRGRGEPGPDGGQIARVARRLAHDLVHGDGIGKDGRTYLFDACVAARGLAWAAATAGTAGGDGAWRPALTRALGAFLDLDVVVLPTTTEPVRWSQAWGGWLERGAGLLDEAARDADEAAWAPLATRLRARVAGLLDGAPPAYLHARLYSAEGAWHRPGEGPAHGRAAARALARGLRGLQQADGSLPAWAFEGGPGRCDVTAQAARLWLATGEGGEHAEAAALALAWLAGVQRADGAMPYEEGSGDATTWASIFADQAAAWAVDGSPDRWV